MKSAVLVVLPLLPLALACSGSGRIAERHEAYKQHIRREAAAAAPTASPTATYPGIPPLAQITSGMATETSATLFTTFAAGATPPLKGAPPLPTSNIVASAWPTLDKTPPTNGPEIQHWMQLLNKTSIPNIAPTVNSADCGDPGNAQNYQNAKTNAWWTCGQYMADGDVSTCQNKDTWGVTYDDGPSPYTPKLLSFLNEHQLKSTFFVIGSRAISRPEVLQTEYMLGHPISVHTWSHPPLTTLTNEEIVAELGWTMLFIKNQTGVTPNTFRPPYGDIDNRVRAIAKMMGLTPILWTSIGQNIQFDTDDWKIPGGTATGPSSYTAFQEILGNASSLTTGFIVLEHDLYQQTVDMAVGYFIPEAIQRNLTLQPVHVCNSQTLESQYIETAGSSSNGTSGTGGGDPSSTTSPAGQSSGRPGSNAASSNAANVGLAAAIVLLSTGLTAIAA